MEEDSKKILLISDLIEARSRKQDELDFYTYQLEILQSKLVTIRREIEITTTIIKMIEKEKIVDLNEYFKSHTQQ